MNGIWLSYILIFTIPVFWTSRLIADSMTTKLYKKVCSPTISSVFNLWRYIQMKKCLFALNEKDLEPKERTQLRRLKVLNKVSNISFFIIMIIALFAIVKQEFF